MSRKMRLEEIVKLTAALCMAGTLFATSCASQGVGAVGAGLDAAVAYLGDNQEGDDDISFTDWLIDELED